MPDADSIQTVGDWKKAVALMNDIGKKPKADGWPLKLVAFQLDVGNLALAGDPVAAHLKDYANGKPGLAIGEGTLGFKAILAAFTRRVLPAVANERCLTGIIASKAHLQQILDILTDAVLAGAACVLDVRRTGQIGAKYKDRTELVTEADRQSDTAILAVFRERFPKIDPSISFHLEESGVSGVLGKRRVGADPLDGTSHFASGGTFYAVQAHYIEDGVPMVGVVFQPEAFLPLSETPHCVGRLASAIRGAGAFVSRSEFNGSGFSLGENRKIVARPAPETRAFVSCVPITGKMNYIEKSRARRVHQSGIIGAATGVGCAGGNVMMVLFGGQDVYANFGSGDDLDLVPPQVIAEEAGLTVWGADRKPPVWHVRKQPFIVAPTPRIAEMFLSAAGVLA